MENIDKILGELNDSQRKAVEYIDGPQLIIAGAGSGKTKALISKIVYLISKGYKSTDILALTFTNKAAREMRDRIEKAIGPTESAKIAMGTFHSIFCKILRRECSYTRLSNKYAIFDSDASVDLITDCIKMLDLDLKKYKPKDIASIISSVKNKYMMDAEKYIKNEQLRAIDDAADRPYVWKIFKYYEDRLAASDAVDFDDILLLTYKLFNEHDDVRKKYSDMWKYVLVDEYQDTNIVQNLIVKQLSLSHNRVTAVGDDFQLIYSFRGSRIENVLEFTSKTYPDAKLFKLEQNYRSTPQIVDAANSLIKKNERQIEKTLFTNNEGSNKVSVCRVESKFKEAMFIINKIKEDVRNGASYDDFTILYRMNYQNGCISKELATAMIPYRIYGGVSFFQREEIKNIVAYLKLSINPNDDDSFKRIFDYPKRRIDIKTLELIQECADKNCASLFSTIFNAEKYGLKYFNKGFEKKVIDFKNKIHSYYVKEKKMKPVDLAKFIIGDTNMVQYIRKSEISDIADDKIQALSELVTMLGDFKGTLHEFLTTAALATNFDDLDDGKPKVKLMTVHASKGLEFNTVFIIGCNQGTFPSNRSLISREDLEEERRLMYVAMTRAKKRLYMFSYDYDFMFGNKKSVSPSQFISEIDKSYISDTRPYIEDNRYNRRRY